MEKNKVDLEILFEKKITQQNFAVQKNSLLNCIKYIFFYTKFPSALYNSINICLLFSTPSRIKSLNKQFLQKDTPTNVLSFPNLSIDPNNNFSSLKKNSHILLGDIAICSNIAQQEAENLNVSLHDRIMYLFSHGVLHLLGFTHDTHYQSELMRDLEKKIMVSCKVNISQI